MPRAARPKVPPVIFDGFLIWFTEWYDPAHDRCSLCSGPIHEDEVPLCLFKDVKAAGQTWQARICEGCMPTVFERLKVK